MIGKVDSKKVEQFLIIFAIALFSIFIIAWAIIGSSRKALGIVFLYLAIDFMTPQPDVDKLIVIPLFWIPLIMALGITNNKVTAYMVGIVFSFCVGVVFLILAIWLLGDGTWTKFKDTWTTIMKHAFTTFWGLLFTILFLILIIIVMWILSRSDENVKSK